MRNMRSSVVLIFVLMTTLGVSAQAETCEQTYAEALGTVNNEMLIARLEAIEILKRRPADRPADAYRTWERAYDRKLSEIEMGREALKEIGRYYRKCLSTQ